MQFSLIYLQNNSEIKC